MPLPWIEGCALHQKRGRVAVLAVVFRPPPRSNETLVAKTAVWIHVHRLDGFADVALYLVLFVLSVHGHVS
eukprot:2969644-Pleurochrysis_carterae.AAC.5